MEMTVLCAERSSSGKRLDIFLAESFRGRYSRTYLKSLISGGKVLVNGETKKGHYRLSGGEQISVAIPPPRLIEVRPEDMPLDIVFEDDCILVVNKPAGMVVHPGVGNFSGTLLNALLHHCKKLSQIASPFKSGLVHRLDKDTSGLMVVAKDDSTHRALAAQFKKREVTREYVALVKGVVEFDEGVVEAPIARDRRDRKKMAVDFSQGRQSITAYKVIQRFKDFTFLKIMPKTGRTHQIRVHMKYIGHPILGDLSYGGGEGILKGASRLGRQALHAKSIGFRHPHTGRMVRFSSELPEDIQKMIDKGNLLAQA